MRFTDLRCDPAGLVQITKTPESRKYEKITKKIQNPPSRVGARKYEKNTEKYKNGDFGAIFVFFRYFCSIFGPQPGKGDFVFFFLVIFSYFRDSGVFVIGTRPAGSQDLRAKESRIGFADRVADPLWLGNPVDEQGAREPGTGLLPLYLVLRWAKTRVLKTDTRVSKRAF